MMGRRKKSKLCACCKDPIENRSRNAKYCSPCAREIRGLYHRDYWIMKKYIAGCLMFAPDHMEKELEERLS